MTYSDDNILLNILNIGRRRERVVYYRKDGTPTLPLPADPYSKIYYLAKGFTLKPSGQSGAITCPICGFEAKDVFGLQSHLRVHRKQEKEEKVE